MMNKTSRFLAIGTVCACLPAWAIAAPSTASNASFFTGPNVGAQFGLNSSSIDGVDNSGSVSWTVGPHLGYNLAMPLSTSGLPSKVILGADIFATFNGQSDHIHNHAHFGSQVYGMDLLAGVPLEFSALGPQHKIMPYFKLGFGTLVGTGDLHGSDTNVRFGLGAEYELTPRWGLTGQWMYEDANNITNNNFTVGLNYHFGGY